MLYLLQIQTPDITKNYLLQIVDTRGQIVKQEIISATNSTISIKDIANGIYFVRIDSEESKKIIKLIKK